MLKQYKPKKCYKCGKTFYKNKDESIDRWVKRKYCSRECSDIHRRGTEKTPIIKNCAVCGKEMTKKYDESWKRWNKKKFCSRDCQTKGTNYKAPSTAFKKGNKPHNFKADGYGYNAVHQWANRHYKKSGVCEKCGKAGKTQWANISGNYERSIDDFSELCYSCHTKMDKANPKRPKMKGSVL